MRPLLWAMMPWTVERPRPEVTVVFLVEKNGSKMCPRVFAFMPTPVSEMVRMAQAGMNGCSPLGG